MYVVVVVVGYSMNEYGIMAPAILICKVAKKFIVVLYQHHPSLSAKMCRWEFLIACSKSVVLHPWETILLYMVERGCTIILVRIQKRKSITINS